MMAVAGAAKSMVGLSSPALANIVGVVPEAPPSAIEITRLL